MGNAGVLGMQSVKVPLSQPLHCSPEGSYTDDANQEIRSPPQQHGPHNEFDDEFEDDDPLPAIGHCKAIYPFNGKISLREIYLHTHKNVCESYIWQLPFALPR